MIDLPPSGPPKPAKESLALVETPAVRTIEDLCKFLSVPSSQTLKTLLIQGEIGPVALLLRGDHELNLLKAVKVPGIESPLQMAGEDAIEKATGVQSGSVGPIGLEIPIYADYATSEMSDFVCGANQHEQHYIGVNWGRDLPQPQFIDLRKAVNGDPCPNDSTKSITVKRGIEVGHVFQLGTKYSKSFDATCLDSNGENAVMWMGCYGIGVSRIVAAAIEQNNDDSGIIWPEPIAPYLVCIVPINFQQSADVARVSLEVHDALTQAGVEVMLDDRDDRPGVKFADMDLLGIPHRLVVSDRGIANGRIEYKRRGKEAVEHLSLDGLIEVLLQRINH